MILQIQRNWKKDRSNLHKIQRTLKRVSISTFVQTLVPYSINNGWMLVLWLPFQVHLCINFDIYHQLSNCKSKQVLFFFSFFRNFGTMKTAIQCEWQNLNFASHWSYRHLLEAENRRSTAGSMNLFAKWSRLIPVMLHLHVAMIQTPHPWRSGDDEGISFCCLF